MVELTPEVVNIIRRQIEGKIRLQQEQEKAVEFQNEVKRVEQEIWAEKSFHVRLPERMAVTDDRMPNDNIIRALRLPSDESTRYLRLPNDSATKNLRFAVTDSFFAADMNNFFNGMLGGNSKRKRK